MDSDLADHGFSVLRASLSLRELGGNQDTWRRGFAHAGTTFEALVKNGPANDTFRGFYQTVAAAAYHLAAYSAQAFSLLAQAQTGQNRSPAEDVLAFLIVRDLQRLRIEAKKWLNDPENIDEGICHAARRESQDLDEVISRIATSTMFRALAFFEFALQIGHDSLFEKARELLRRAISLTSAAGTISLWWILRITANLIDDLWSSSLHKVLPNTAPSGSKNYTQLRTLFISELFSRRVSEIELWPSQILAAKRASDLSDNLVVSLPTSAGKTRIAEIASLMTLSCELRVFIVTPLRALSAQTERSFRKTFIPFGFSVSSLYGSSGLAGEDIDAMQMHNIVIATPEKLDFALRNNPSIINDVGLIIFDEGHLIGPSEREIRYENLVQRILRRDDHKVRRIVCLSAILPSGDQLNDLTAWIRNDNPGEPVQSNWRPTRQRYGTLSWIDKSARLSFALEADGPFIRHFVTESIPKQRRKKPFPKDNTELTLAAAWKFSNQGKRVLIFCTQRDNVERFANAALDLYRHGFLDSLLTIPEKIKRAIEIGREWLGVEHPAVQCLSFGLAIHHGRLPKPFLRELESLLSAGVLNVTVASPTLAQGLNLNAAILLIPSLYRAGKLIKEEEFANVAGRAGRAFVDLEGLIIHVMHKPDNWRHKIWRKLVRSTKSRSLSSGLILIIDEVIQRLSSSGIIARHDAKEYLANSLEAWLPTEKIGDHAIEPMENLIERLDTTILGLIDALDTDSDELPRLLDEALKGSLWERQISRRDIKEKQKQLTILVSRAELIWSKTTADQRRGQFAMGVGLESGLAIDAYASELNSLLDIANTAALSGDKDTLTSTLVRMGERLLKIRPFVPDNPLPENWRDLLRAWIRGEDASAIGQDNMRIIEEAFTYRLVWAIEAVRMNRHINGDESEHPIEGAASACLETGLPSYTMATLVRAGLPSRIAAKTAIERTAVNITNRSELKAWLQSDDISDLEQTPDWPSLETHSIWQQFRREALLSDDGKWVSQAWTVQSSLLSPFPMRVEIDDQNGEVSITTPDFRQLATIKQKLHTNTPSLFKAESSQDGSGVKIHRIGLGKSHWIS